MASRLSSKELRARALSREKTATVRPKPGKASAETPPEDEYATGSNAPTTGERFSVADSALTGIDLEMREGAWVTPGPATRTILRGPIQPLREQAAVLLARGLGSYGPYPARPVPSEPGRKNHRLEHLSALPASKLIKTAA